MYEEELVVLYRKNNYAYCKYQTFALESEEAKQAHAYIRQLQQDGYQIINVENMTEEEKNQFLERIDSEIEEYKMMIRLDVNMIIKASDLYSVFDLDGSSFIDNLECTTPEIKKLLKNPEEINELEKIWPVPYMTGDIHKRILTGYMIPMKANGDFFSLDEVKNIFSMDYIDTSKDGIDCTKDGIDCTFALNPYSARNSRFMKSFKENEIEFEKEKQSRFEEYKANYELIQSYKNTKDQILEIYFKNCKKI